MKSKYKDISEFHLMQWKLAFETGKPKAAEFHKALYLENKKLCEIPLDDMTFYHADDNMKQA